MSGARAYLVRTERLLGAQAMERLHAAHVLVLGIGGVGAGAVEALARSGVGHLTLVDPDCVDETNINRQLIALHSTVGRPKVDVAKERVLDIAPDCSVTALPMRYDAQHADAVLSGHPDFVLDCIDTMSAKVDLAVRCRQLGIPMIACMGTGNKLDASRLRIADLYQTHIDPIARVMRKELRARGVEALPVLFSDEVPAQIPNDSEGARRSVPASVAFVPPVAGMMMAGYAVEQLIQEARVS
nr:tRNA threonylcarbamoyladenosine dehydratase [Maliibacterium massiliense]